jgi:hypothetical protein
MTAEEWLKSDAGELAHKRLVSHAMNTHDSLQVSAAWQKGVRAGWEACEQSKQSKPKKADPEAARPDFGLPMNRL